MSKLTGHIEPLAPGRVGLWLTSVASTLLVAGAAAYSSAGYAQQAASARGQERSTVPSIRSRNGHEDGDGPQPGQEPASRPPSTILGDGPWELQTREYRVKVTKIADKLRRPWSIAFLPDGGILVGERIGHLQLIRPGSGTMTEITGLPEMLIRYQVGLMDIALHPDFRRNKLIYFGYSSPTPDGGSNCAIGRGRYDGGTQLTNVEELFVGSPPIPPTDLQNAKIKLAFSPDGYLFATCSVADFDRLSAQNPRSDYGKILRFYDDGTIPADNPLIGKSEFGLTYKPEIYTLGHRATLGLAFHPDTGQLWLAENGPFGGDELNLLKPGANYGWPIVSQGLEYGGTPFLLHKDGYEDPVMTWSPALAPSGLVFYSGDKFPKWKGNALMGGLAGQRIERVEFGANGRPHAREGFLVELGQRIRDIRQGPDGNLYIVTDYAEHGALLKIEPAAAAPTEISGRGSGAATAVAIRAAVPQPARTPAPQSTHASVTQWDRIYTAAQAAHGKELYRQHCAACHGEQLQGFDRSPALVGEEIVNSWARLNLATLIDRTQKTMPLAAPGSLTLETCADIFAHILESQGYPAGNTKLSGKLTDLSKITFVAGKPK